MRTRILTIFALLFALSLCATPVVQAAQTPPAKAVADKPAPPKADRAIPVAVEHEGTDTLGAKLAFQLKGVFNTSSLFTLTEKDEPKLKVLISTVAEFPSRPNIASAYSLSWVFSQAEGTLNFLLAREVGLVTAEELDSLVAKVAERTDGVAAKYAYLFTK